MTKNNTTKNKRENARINALSLYISSSEKTQITSELSEPYYPS